MVLLLFNDITNKTKDIYELLDNLWVNKFVDDIVIQHTYELKSIDMRAKVKYISRFLEIHSIVSKKFINIF